MSTTGRLLVNWVCCFLVCCFLLVGGAAASTFKSPCPNVFENVYWACVYDGFNRDGVVNNPSIETIFTLDRSWEIDAILTYHWNYGAGQDPTPINGMISIYDQDSNNLIGSWAASSIGMPANTLWAAYPNVILPRGTYRIVDSDPSTWSYSTTDLVNPGEKPDWTQNAGFAEVFTEVPEPASMLLVGGGMALFGFRRRIRRG